MPSSARHRARRGLWAAALGIAFAVGPAPPAAAKVHLSRKQAVASAFPDAQVEERSFVLTAEQAAAVESRAQSKLESRIVKLYTGRREEAVVGYAFIDIHDVRTLPEAVLVVLTPAGRVRAVRMVAFYEPPEYEPSARWLEQFEGRGLGPGTHVGDGIHAIAGSTLSSHAVAGGVRRALALFEVLVRAATERREGG